MTIRLALPAALALLAASAACRGEGSAAPARPVTDQLLQDAPPGDGWLNYGRDWSNQRYVPLTEINRTTVAGLHKLWEHDPGTLFRKSARNESTPIVAEAFATESGLTCLKLKNFRDKWVGQTEANLEKVLGLVEALGYVLLIVDEADRGLSTGEGSDGGVNSRVIARLKEFMSDTSHRGRVVILMMTNRPDKLDADLKRPGRFDLKIPFFFPETAEERRGIFQAVARKNGLVLAPDVSFDHAVEATAGFSAAEIEAVMLAAAALAGDDDQDRIEQAHVDKATEDVIPSRDNRMLEYMELLAVFECSARRMLPDRVRDVPTDEVQARLDQLRLILGRRAA